MNLDLITHVNIYTSLPDCRRFGPESEKVRLDNATSFATLAQPLLSNLLACTKENTDIDGFYFSVTDPIVAYEINATGLMLASYLGLNDIVLQLLKGHADPDIHGEEIPSALLIAAWKGNSKVVSTLIEHKANVNLQTSYGYTALHGASHWASGHDDIVSTLIIHGAAVNTQDNYGDTPLILASQSGKRNVVSTLLENGANPNIQNNDNNTALINAAAYRHTDVLSLLLEHGADIELQGKWFSVLLLASYNGLTGVVNTLLEHNANVNIQNSYGYTALNLANQIGHNEIISILLNHQADPNIQDHHGNTPLHWAASQGNSDAVTALLDHDAKENIIDIDDK